MDEDFFIKNNAKSTDRILWTNLVGLDALKDAIQDYDGSDEETEKPDDHAAAGHDFQYDEDANEADIPHDLDGWHWAFSSDSESEHEGQNVDTKGTNDGNHCEVEKVDVDEKTAATSRTRIALQRPEYIECHAAGLLARPEGATLGVHPGSSTWRGSYPGSSHYGRSWGATRSPKKALLEIMKLILEDHLAIHKGDKLAKNQLSRVSKAWNDA